MTIHHDLAAEAVKASPPLTVVGLSVAGVGLQDWVLLLTLIYTIIQIYLLVRDKVVLPYLEKRNGCK
jgi:hypothetical protein